MKPIYRNILLWSPAVLIVGMVGCPSFSNPEMERSPEMGPIPTQNTSTGIETRVDLGDYVVGSPEGLQWQLVAGDGEMQGSDYVHVFRTLGAYEVKVKATNEAGKFTEGDFSIVVESISMAVVQRGNDLDLLDGAVGTLYPLASGGASPLVFRQRLPNGSIVYERMGASSIELFVNEFTGTRQIGGLPGINTVYDTHTGDNRIFFEEGSASETGLYMWDPESGATTTVALRQGMHNRNAFVTDNGICYFEYGNNGQSDIYMWRLGQHWNATVFSSDYPEVIQTLMPDGGIVFSTKGLAGEDDLYYYRDTHGPFTVGGDLSPLIQGSDMRYKTHTNQSLVVVETDSGAGDVWMWSPLGLTTRAVGATSAEEHFVTLTPDGQVLYRVSHESGQEDLKIYHYSTDTSRDVAVSSHHETLEAVLPNSDVIYAAEYGENRDLHRFNSVTGKSEVIASVASARHKLAAALCNGFIVYSRAGSVEDGTFLWNPGTGHSTLLAGAGSDFAGECADGDFVLSLTVNGQKDLAYWDQLKGRLMPVAQTETDEVFQAGFGDGVVIYSTIVTPKVSADLFHWKRGTRTRISDGRVDHSVIAVVGDVR